MTSQISSLAQCNFVFYEQGQFPKDWLASAQGEKSDSITSLVLALLQSPLFGSGSYLGPRYYKDEGLKQVPFLKEVRNEPVFFWDKDTKKEGVTEPDKIVIRGTQLVEGMWVVYYSMTDSPTPLYGMLYNIFQQVVKIHFPQSPSLHQYDRVVGGPGLIEAAKNEFSKIGKPILEEEAE